MSDNKGATSAPTLEEALAEIEGLKEQLSGSDLKVFTQNRDLRQENGKLREEITRLTEECVTQTFAVRGLEKNKASLEKQIAAHLATIEEHTGTIAEQAGKIAEQGSKIESQEAKIADLEGRTSELTEQLGVHRSQEIHLSQELERTISTNAEELSKIKTEHGEQLETTRQTLEQARAEIERELSEKLAARAREVEGLEKRVEAFKEEFLSQEFIAVPPVSADEGRAFQLLRSKMEGLLGFPGRTLVEQVFRHSGADENTTDPAVLEEAFEALQDTASKLVRTPEQEQELVGLLKSAWQELGLGSGEGAPVAAAKAVAQPEEPAQPEAEDSADEEAVEEPEPAAEEAIAEPPVSELSPEAEQVAELDAEPEVAADTSAHTDQTTQSATEAETAVAEVEPQESEASPEAVSDEAANQPDATQSEEEPGAEPGSAAQQDLPSPVTVDPETAPVPETSVEEAPAEASLLDDSEAVTEEDLPPVVEANDEPETAPFIDSIDEALAQPSVEESAEEVSTEGAADEPAGETSPPEAPADDAVEAAVEPGLGALEEAGEADSTAEDDGEEATEDNDASDDEEASEDDDAEEDSDFDAAAAALQNGDFAKAWPVFHRLRHGSPTEPTYLVGEIASLAGLERYQEAYALGKGLDVAALEDSAEVYKESFESVLIGLADQADSMVVRKQYLIELIEMVEDPERALALLDEVEEIGLRTPREGELSLFQAKARIGQDDVTEYLIEALGSLSNRIEIFDLLRQNLERYPELTPLSEFLARLLDSGRDEALEAESGAKELISTGEALEDLLEEVDPGEEALVQVFLEHLLPRTGVKMDLPSEAFEELLQESEPAAFVGALRQALRSVDYTVFFDEIEVLSYDGDEHFLLRSSPEPKATLLFGSEVDDVPPEELRFLVLRELFSMHRRHSHLAHLAAQLDDKLRYNFVKSCLEMHKENNFEIPGDLLARVSELESLAAEGGQDADFQSKLEEALSAIYQATESDSFLDLGDFLFNGQLHKKWLDPLADGFAAKQTGLVVASFAIARDTLSSDDFEALEESGFQWLYEAENVEKFRELRLRLQRLWVMPFKALVADADE